jgi:hypothetical protein
MRISSVLRHRMILKMHLSIMLAAAVTVFPYGQADAEPKACGDILMTCSTGCIGKKNENSCLGACIKKHDNCVAAGGWPANAEIERGPKTPKPPRGKPGIAVIPAAGGSILDSDPGMGPHGPAGAGAPAAGKPASAPAKIY